MKICICDDMKSELQMLETLCLEYLHEREVGGGSEFVRRIPAYPLRAALTC